MRRELSLSVSDRALQSESTSSMKMMHGARSRAMSNKAFTLLTQKKAGEKEEMDGRECCRGGQGGGRGMRGMRQARTFRSGPAIWT
jgi:hypothetical protein